MGGYGKRGSWKAKAYRCLDLARKARKKGNTAQVKQHVSDAKYCFRRARRK